MLIALKFLLYTEILVWHANHCNCNVCLYYCAEYSTETGTAHRMYFNTLRTGSFKLFKRPFPGFLTILTL